MWLRLVDTQLWQFTNRLCSKKLSLGKCMRSVPLPKQPCARPVTMFPNVSELRTIDENSVKSNQQGNNSRWKNITDNCLHSLPFFLPSLVLIRRHEPYENTHRFQCTDLDFCECHAGAYGTFENVMNARCHMLWSESTDVPFRSRVSSR